MIDINKKITFTILSTSRFFLYNHNMISNTIFATIASLSHIEFKSEFSESKTSEG